jgi:hypothetical protein
VIPESYLEIVALVYKKVMEINNFVDLGALKRHNAGRRRRETGEAGV